MKSIKLTVLGVVDRNLKVLAVQIFLEEPLCGIDEIFAVIVHQRPETWWRKRACAERRELCSDRDRWGPSLS